MHKPDDVRPTDAVMQNCALMYLNMELFRLRGVTGLLDSNFPIQQEAQNRKVKF